MSCIYKMQEGMASYTSTEKKIAKYILQNPNEVVQSSAQALGGMVGVSAAHMSNRDAAIAISYSGRTHEVNTAMKFAKEIGAMTIAITQFRKTPLSKLSDILLYIPTTERELRLGAIASRNASLIVTDLLYLGLAKSDMKQTKEYIVKTRNAINRLK